jgi:hypothetical protein
MNFRGDKTKKDNCGKTVNMESSFLQKGAITLQVNKQIANCIVKYSYEP